jgi:hypothetical protein
LNHLYTRRYSMASRAVLKVLYIPTTDLERNVRISILHLPSQKLNNIAAASSALRHNIVLEHRS